jgi:PadR family transcriptional regulator, regulatory protein PadR
MTLHSMRVLQVFLDEPTTSLAGADIQRALHLPSGTLYPILFRFESAGWLRSSWERVNPKEVGRPRRRVYVITPLGVRRASEELTTLRLGLRV